uniref:hypothetical protein n=1 Tax=Sphingomonas sp. Ant H11 TaxID=1564113 RepID=UPI00068D606F
MHTTPRRLVRHTPPALTMLLLGCSLTSLAYAETGAAPVPEPAAPVQTEATNDDIVVTGRALPGSVIGDIPPENRLNPADVAAYGVSTISELLDALADQTQSDQGRDSSSAPVVLVNGKRISGVNEIGDLPTESILRVDILPEEVALKYGYDAQRKVVNIILRRRFIARVANLTGGLATEGEGENGAAVLSYVRIHDSDRFNLSAKAVASARLLQSERNVTPTNTLIDDTAYRTLKPTSRSYTLNGTYAHRLSDTITATFNANGGYQTSDALNGLPTMAVGSILSDEALRQHSETATAHGGATLNADLSKNWQVSAIGTFDHSDTRTATDTASRTPLGSTQRQHASSISDAGSGSVVAMGKLLTLPAGPLRTSLRVGGAFSALESDSTGVDASSGRTFNRSEFNAQASLDVPLTSTKAHFLDTIGTLSANVNVGTTRLSDYGALGTLGYGLNWTPRKGISIIVSMNEDRVAPTLEQLNAPTITTANVLVYDYRRGKTVSVTQISGGSSALAADDRHVFKASLSAAVIARTRTKLTLSANYIDSRTDNAIGSLPTLSAAVEAAFPDRYIRDASGTLVEVDARPVNFAREYRQEIRSGLTFSEVLRPARRPQPPANWHPPAGFPPPGRPMQPPGHAVADDTPESDRTAPGKDGDDIVVEGRRSTRDTFAPPPPGDGDGPPPGPH